MTEYRAKQPNAQGYIAYSDQEHQTWNTLIGRQLEIMNERACDEFKIGVERLAMPLERIPQCNDLNTPLQRMTGWSVHPVSALIPTDYFFTLLSNRLFPAATFIRVPEELDYLQEPDIFHEFFGHCPLLTDPIYADFMQTYGKIALRANTIQRHYLARLYWFTVEFGLIKTAKGYRAYGGGILSSKAETIYAVESDIPERRLLGSLIQALRTPYRIDIKQPIYYAITGFDELYDLLADEKSLFEKIDEAEQLGDLAPTFPPTREDNMVLRC